MRTGVSACVVALSAFWLVPQNAGQTPAQTRESVTWIERGKANLDRSLYKNAETAFSNSIALDPSSAQAHWLLARALLGQLALNLRLFPDTEGLLPRAEAEANKALELSPADVNALCVLGLVKRKLAVNTKDPREKAMRLYQGKVAFDRALEIDPRSVEAHHELAQMVIELAMMPVLEARVQSDKTLARPGPIGDAELRRGLQKKYQRSIDDAMSHERQALAVNPSFAPAMSGMSALLLLRASLRDSDSDYSADFKSAEEWRQKAAALIPPPSARPVDTSGIGGIVGSVPSAAPPPR